MKMNIRLSILFLCLCGIALSIASLRSHYATSATDYCDLNETLNCDIVNRSKFSEIFQIPVALIGLLGYAVLLGLTVRTQKVFQTLRLSFSVGGLGFALYLAYVEGYILRTWCLLCIGSLAAIAGIAVLSLIDILHIHRPKEQGVSAGARS
jgi:uncharacterized membrane protein